MISSDSTGTLDASCHLPSHAGSEALDSGQAVSINYYRNPVLARKSVAQLLQRPGLLGFSNLVWVSGDWRGLASPFCRIGRETPEELICEPEFVWQKSANAEIGAAFCGPDCIGIEVLASRPMGLYSGAPGKIHHNGGTANQQWMAFDAFRDGATLTQPCLHEIHAKNGDYVAVFVGEGIHLAGDGNGWSKALGKGRFYLGCGIALRDPELARARALTALEELTRNEGLAVTRRRLQREWAAMYDTFGFPAELSEEDLVLARNAVWCMYSNLAAPEGCLRRPAIIAAKIQYPGVFPWDSAFAAVALKEADPELARNQIELYTDMLTERGTGEVGEMTTLHAGGGVQFPLFSWAAWRIHQADPDQSFLSRIYRPLAAHADWWLREHASTDGIPFYRRVVCLDDSPRFDMFAQQGRMSLCEPIYGADLITICAADQRFLARIAEELGEFERAATHRAAADRLVRFADEMLYDPGLGRYIDLGSESGRQGTVNTPFNHFPGLYSERSDRREAAAFALSPSGPFWGRFGLATVSPEESSFDPCRIWRGPIWFSANMLIAKSAAETGFPEVAEAIASSSLEIICANAPLPNGMMEYFNCFTGEGSGAHHIATMTAAPYLSFLLGHHLESDTP